MQLGSGHSISCGDGGLVVVICWGVVVVVVVVVADDDAAAVVVVVGGVGVGVGVEACAEGVWDTCCSGTGLLLLLPLAPLELDLERLAFFGSGAGLSASLPFLLLLFPVSDLTGLGGGLKVGVEVPPRLPLLLAFLNLPLVSATVRSGVGTVVVAAVVALPLLPLPLGVRDSISLVGESQNLGMT